VVPKLGSSGQGKEDLAATAVGADLQQIPFQPLKNFEQNTITHLGDFDEPASSVLFDVQVEPFGLYL
jgi:hypothetical protein